MNPKNDAKKMEVYDFINGFINEYGVCPSTREIAEGVRCSISTAHKFVMRLEEEGYIEKYGRNQIVTRQNMFSFDKVPVVGAIACGKPKLAIEDIQAYIPINKDMLGEGEFFALIADGESMIEAGIDPGDIVFIRKQEAANEGDIVAAVVPDECSDGVCATLKRFYRDPKKKMIRLHPENSSMKDIYVKDATILGVAVKSLKDIKI